MNTTTLKADWELSQKQIEICKIIFTEGKRINYLAKDKQGRLMGFNKKPYKHTTNTWRSNIGSVLYDIEIFKHHFTNLPWDKLITKNLEIL